VPTRSRCGRGCTLADRSPPPEARPDREAPADGYSDFCGQESWFRLRLTVAPGLGRLASSARERMIVDDDHRYAALHRSAGCAREHLGLSPGGEEGQDEPE